MAVRRRLHELFAPLIHAAARRGEDDHPPCYADSLLALRVPNEGDRPLTDAEIVSLCSEFLNAGTDTTVTLVEWIMAELANNPNVQAKVATNMIILIYFSASMYVQSWKFRSTRRKPKLTLLRYKVKSEKQIE